jgi:hypothetical protein
MQDSKRSRPAADVSPAANADIHRAAAQHISSGAGIIRNLTALDATGLVSVIASAADLLAQRHASGENVQHARTELLQEVRSTVRACLCVSICAVRSFIM